MFTVKDARVMWTENEDSFHCTCGVSLALTYILLNGKFLKRERGRAVTKIMVAIVVDVYAYHDGASEKTAKVYVRTPMMLLRKKKTQIFLFYYSCLCFHCCFCGVCLTISMNVVCWWIAEWLSGMFA